MKRRNLITATLAITLGMFLFSSCDNAETNDSTLLTEIDVQSAEDDALVDDMYNNLDSEIDQELSNLESTGYNPSMFKSTDDEPYICKTITVDHPDSTTFPKVITIDYGEGCSVEINGQVFTRKGKIVITITNKWFLQNAQRTVEFVDFYVNDIKIEGTRTVTNKGENNDGNLEFNVTLVDGKVIFNDTLQYSREADRTREWVRAANPIDDIWYVSGGCNGVNLDGFEYSHTITEKLMIVRCEDFRYRWMIVQGIVEIVRNGQTGTIDYGNGTCDDTAILTVNGERKEIKIRKRYHHKRRMFAKAIGR